MPTRASARLLIAVALSTLWLGYVPRAVLIVPPASLAVIDDIRLELRGLMLAVYPYGVAALPPLPRIALFDAGNRAEDALPFAAILTVAEERDAALAQAVEWLEVDAVDGAEPIVVAPHSDRRRAREAAAIRRRHGWRSILLEDGETAGELVERLPTAAAGRVLVLLGDRTPHVVRTIRTTPRVAGAVVVAEAGLSVQAERLAELGVGSDAVLALDLRSAVRSARNYRGVASQTLHITTRFIRY